LVGTVDSHVLLEADNANTLLPAGVSRDANEAQLVFVDEANCIGCRSCAEVARSTFQMEADFGAARAYQQCGDEEEVIEEAIDCCPVDCIHLVRGTGGLIGSLSRRAKRVRARSQVAVSAHQCAVPCPRLACVRCPSTS
jgi:ferredoxin